MYSHQLGMFSWDQTVAFSGYLVALRATMNFIFLVLVTGLQIPAEKLFQGDRKAALNGVKPLNHNQTDEGMPLL
jgi:hypothetical protein